LSLVWCVKWSRRISKVVIAPFWKKISTNLYQIKENPYLYIYKSS